MVNSDPVCIPFVRCPPKKGSPALFSGHVMELILHCVLRGLFAGIIVLNQPHTIVCLSVSLSLCVRAFERVHVRVHVRACV